MWKKVLAPTLLVSLLWAGLGVAINHYTQSFRNSIERVVSVNAPRIDAAAEMEATVWKIESGLMVIERDQSYPPSILVEEELAFERVLASIDRGSFTSPEVDLLKTIHQRFADYRELLHSTL